MLTIAIIVYVLGWLAAARICAGSVLLDAIAANAEWNRRREAALERWQRAGYSKHDRRRYPLSWMGYAAKKPDGTWADTPLRAFAVGSAWALIWPVLGVIALTTAAWRSISPRTRTRVLVSLPKDKRAQVAALRSDELDRAIND